MYLKQVGQCPRGESWVVERDAMAAAHERVMALHVNLCTADGGESDAGRI